MTRFVFDRIKFKKIYELKIEINGRLKIMDFGRYISHFIRPNLDLPEMRGPVSRNLSYQK